MKKLRIMVLVLALMAMVAGLLPRAAGLMPAAKAEGVTTYAELKTAVNNGGAITLDSDITCVSDISLRKTTVLDLNGHTLNIDTNQIYCLSNVTIQDSSELKAGKIFGTGAYKIYVGNTGDNNCYPGSLTLKSGTLITSGNGTVRVTEVGELTVDGGTIQGSRFSVFNSAAGAKTIVNGGTISALEQQAIRNLGTLTVKGGQITARQIVGIYISSGEVTVSGGTISALTDAINIKDNSGAKLSITGGTVSATESSGVLLEKVQRWPYPTTA